MRLRGVTSMACAIAVASGSIVRAAELKPATIAADGCRQRGCVRRARLHGIGVVRAHQDGATDRQEPATRSNLHADVARKEAEQTVGPDQVQPLDHASGGRIELRHLRDRGLEPLGHPLLRQHGVGVGRHQRERLVWPRRRRRASRWSCVSLTDRSS
jgi:hypothetical protein